MEYLLKACGIIVVFYAFYNLFLRTDTFFKWNRLFLISGLFFAALLPTIIIPIYIEYTPIEPSNFSFESSESTNINVDLATIDYLIGTYLLGVIYFFIRFTFQLFSLIRIICESKRQRIGKYIYVKTEKDISPFSFFNWIVFNPNQFNKIELEQILTHEKAHADQYHSIDVLLTKLATVVLWFNPFVWLYSKILEQNLEFLADNTAIENSDCKKSYQYTLLKTSVPTHQLALSNNFYNSLIKKRIVMLHKSKSKKLNLLKLFGITPLLMLFLMSFSTQEVYVKKETTPVYNIVPETQYEATETPLTEDVTIEQNALKETVIAQKPVITKPKTKKVIPTSKNKIVKAIAINDEEVIIITKNTSDAELDNIVEAQKENGMTLKFSNIKRNDDGEIIAIKVEANAKNSNANYSIKSDSTIKPIMIKYDINHDTISIGNAKHSNKIVFVTSDSKKNIITSGVNKEVVIVEEISNKDIIEEGIEEDVEEDVVKEVITITESKGSGTHDKRVIVSGNTDDKVVIRTDNNDQKPLIILNGKELKKRKLKSLESNDIKKIKVLKGNDAVEKYGKKGENGVIEVITKRRK